MTKISDLIFELQARLKEHGDLRVTTYEPGGGWGVVEYRTGNIQLKEIREKRKREYKTHYRHSFDQEPAIEKVLHV